MQITRRKFFFFGLAAGVGLFLPKPNIELDNSLKLVSHKNMRVPLELQPGGTFQYFNPDGGDLGRGIITESKIVAAELERILPNINKLFEMDDKFYSSLKKRTS